MSVVPRESFSALPEPYEVPPSQEWDGNDGSWSTFKISIGTPAQEFRLLASTQSGQTFAVLPDGCIPGFDPVDCAKSRGAQILDSAQSPGFLTNLSSTWELIGEYDIDLEKDLNYTARGYFGYDKLTLGPAGETGLPSVDNQILGGVADMSFYLGHIALGISKSKFSSKSQSVEPLLYQMRNNSQIPSIAFSYTAGAKYRLKSVVGQLILGGYDLTRFEPNTSDFSFSFSTDSSRLLTVGVESITATNTLQGTQSLSSSFHITLIDTTVSQLWLPRSICDAFEQSFGLTYDPDTDLYLINATMRDQVKARNPSITIKLIDSLEGAATNFSNIVLPYSAFDLQASSPYYDNATNYFPIRRATNESQYTLGRVLLQEAYLIVDYERANFTVAQTAFPDPLPDANIVAISPPGLSLADPTSPRSFLNTGAKAGIAVGCAVFALFLAVLALFFYRRRRQRAAISCIGTDTGTRELDGMAVSEFESLSIASPNSHKILGGTQELGGTPRAELAGSFREQSCLSVNEVPQELETPSSTMQPMSEGVTADEFESYRSGRKVREGIDSADVSSIGSQVDINGRPQSVVSPLQGRFLERQSIVSPLAGKFHEHIA